MIAVSFEKVSKVGKKGKLGVVRGVQLAPWSKEDKELISEILRRGVEVDCIDENGAIYLRLCK